MTAPRGFPAPHHAIARLVHLWSGRMGWTGIAALLLAYVWLGLAPFRWLPPRRVQNGARLAADGLLVPTEGSVTVQGLDEWVRAACGNRHLQLEMRVMPRGSTGTLLAYNDLSGDSGNLVLWQNGPELHLYVGMPGHGMHAGRWYAIAYAFRDPGWHDVEVEIDDRQLVFGVKGVETQRDSWPECPLAYWQTGQSTKFTLANVIGGADPWLGEVHQCKLISGASRFGLLSPAQCKIPDVYHANLRFDDHLDLRPTRDNLSNFLGFVPLGGLFTLVLHHRRGAAAWGMLACLLISVGMECTQAFFGHVSSVTDVATNGMGGAVGATVACVFVRVTIKGAERKKPCASMPQPNA